MCTTAYILVACKLSLWKGRYTFRHDTVLHKIIESCKSFILNIKQAVTISPKSSIKFVKRRTKVSLKRTLPVGILHQVSDIGLGSSGRSRWQLLLSNSHCFHSAKTWYYNILQCFKKGHTHRINMSLWRKHGIMAQY